MGKIRTLIDAIALPHMENIKLGSGRTLRCLAAGVSLFAAVNAMAGEDKSHEETMAALNARIAATQERVAEVCGEKDEIVAAAKADRAAARARGEKWKPKKEGREERLQIMRDCSNAKTELTGLEAYKATEEADESYRKLVNSMRNTQ